MNSTQCPDCGRVFTPEPARVPDVEVSDVEFLLRTDSPESIARRVGCADLRELTRALYRKGEFKLAGRLNDYAA
jgi:hypothetical protein